MYVGTIYTYKVLIAVFVDDILVALASDTVVMHVKTMFHKKYRIEHMGLAAEFLNIRISQCPSLITIDQEHYIRSIGMYIGIIYIRYCNIMLMYHLCLNTYIAMLCPHLTNTLHLSLISHSLR